MRICPNKEQNKQNAKEGFLLALNVVFVGSSAVFCIKQEPIIADKLNGNYFTISPKQFTIGQAAALDSSVSR